MILRPLRKRLAMLLAEWRYRNDAAALSKARRSIGGRFRRINTTPKEKQ